MPAPAKAKYRDSPPDVSSTGIGKCYDRGRMFFMRKTGLIEFIENDYSVRAPTAGEAERFRRDLTQAAAADRKVARFLEEFPELAIGRMGEGGAGGAGPGIS